MIIGGMIFDETWIFMAFAEKGREKRRRQNETTSNGYQHLHLSWLLKRLH